MKNALAGFVVAALLVAAPAHADPPECFTLPALPGECLTEPVYDAIVEQSASLVGLQHQLTTVIGQLGDAYVENAALHNQVVALTDERDAALQLAARRLERILILRARLHELRLRP